MLVQPNLFDMRIRSFITAYMLALIILNVVSASLMAFLLDPNLVTGVVYYVSRSVPPNQLTLKTMEINVLV